MLGKRVGLLEEGETVEGRYRIERHNGHRRITFFYDAYQIATLDDDVPAQLQKDILAHILGIEENPDAVKHYKEHELAQTIIRLCNDANELLNEYRESTGKL